MEVFPYKDDNAFIQIDRHFGLYYPVPPSPFPVPLFGFHYGNGILSWGPGWSHKDNKGKVLADGARLISTGHKVEHVIIFHSNIPPVPPGINTLIPLLLLGSSNESVFCSTTVVATDGPVAVAVARVVGINLACNDEWNAPTSVVKTGGTVLLGFTWRDFGLGLLRGALSVGMDKLIDVLVGRAFNMLPKSVRRRFTMFYHRTMKHVPGLEGVGAGRFNNSVTGRFQSFSQEVSESLVETAVNTADSATSATDKAKDPVMEASENLTD